MTTLKKNTDYQMALSTYQYHTQSNAAPFVSDSGTGFIEAGSPMAALKKIVCGYKHPCGLYSACILMPTVGNKVVARYFSSRAATQQSAGTGEHYWDKDKLIVNGIIQKIMPEKFELV